MKNWLTGLVKKSDFIDRTLLILRRIYLSFGRGYPRWKEFTGLDKVTTSKSPQNIFFITSIGSHLPAMQLETSLAATLRLRGHYVAALLCDGVLPGCQMCEPRLFSDTQHFLKHGPTKRLCGHCFPPGKNVYEQAGINVFSYSQFLTKEKLAEAEKLSQQLDLTHLKKYELEGLKLGEHAMAGALRFFARATLPEDRKITDVVLRRYLKSALITAFVTQELIKKHKVDVMVFHHGIYVPQGIVGEVARKMGVRVVNWNPAYRKDCFIFSHLETYHHSLMSEPTETWAKMRWDASKDKVITDYLKSRWTGDNDWIKFIQNPTFEKEKIVKELNLDLSKPVIGCLTNVLWDAQLHYPANAFENLLEWLFVTIEYFAERQDLQLVIRIHPAEVNGTVPSKQPVAGEIQKRFPKLPSNIKVILPDNPLSTYVISELCDAVIIYGTKTGVELASVGIPVIVAGEAWIRNKGITTDVNSRGQYMDILNSLPLKKRMEPGMVLKAKKYAYHFFFRRMIPVKIFEKGPGWPPYQLKARDAQELTAGADPGLDCICQGIVEGTPFVFDI